MIHETPVPELHPFIEVSSDIDMKMDGERPGQKRQNLTGSGHLIGDIEGLGQSKSNLKSMQPRLELYIQCMHVF